jgi:hypothetical protein
LDDYEDELYSSTGYNITTYDHMDYVFVDVDTDLFVKEVIEKEKQEELEDNTPTFNRTEQNYILSILNKE